MHFADRLTGAVRRAESHRGGDRPTRPRIFLPAFLRHTPRDRAGLAEALQTFGFGVVDAVASARRRVKFQAAFYEALGPEGLGALNRTARLCPEPGLDRDHRRQAQRYRFDGRGLCTGLPGKDHVGDARRPSWNCRRADGESLPRQRTGSRRS